MFRILAIAGALLGLASAAQADVWLWTDHIGTIHYSDNWVPGSTQVKTAESRSSYSAPASAPAASSPNASANASSDPAQAERDKRAVEADKEKLKADQCKQAREAYDKALQSRRIYKEGAGGTREYLSDADADAYRLQLMTARRQACGS
jgi:hypothetical protein